ncbi:MAG: hypothetical protein ACJ77K_17645 [Bacteroidia bacterium]|jgi:hypothetical protein
MNRLLQHHILTVLYGKLQDGKSAPHIPFMTLKELSKRIGKDETEIRPTLHDLVITGYVDHSDSSSGSFYTINQPNGENAFKSERYLYLAKEAEKISKKEEQDFRLKEMQIKTFWWIFYFGVFGGICGIITLAIRILETLRN